MFTSSPFLGYVYLGIHLIITFFENLITNSNFTRHYVQKPYLQSFTFVRLSSTFPLFLPKGVLLYNSLNQHFLTKKIILPASIRCKMCNFHNFNDFSLSRILRFHNRWYTIYIFFLSSSEILLVLGFQKIDSLFVETYICKLLYWYWVETTLFKYSGITST